MKVLFIGGVGRSGSTMLELALSGLSPRVCAVGEIMALLHPSHLDLEDSCQCGEPIVACPFWREVLQRGIGGPDGLRRFHRDVSARLRWRTQARGLWAPPRLPPASSAHLERLLRTALEVAEADVLVDASKHPSHGGALAGIGPVELRVLHLVRDPRAVAWSWHRPRARRGVRRPAAMPRQDPGSVARRWTAHNLLVQRLGVRAGVRYRRVRYEDVVRDPGAALTAVARWAGLPPPRIEPRGSVPVPTDAHGIAGNPMRFDPDRSGWLDVRADLTWQRQMPTRAQASVWGWTALLARHYGYRWGHRASSLRAG